MSPDGRPGRRPRRAHGRACGAGTAAGAGPGWCPAARGSPSSASVAPVTSASRAIVGVVMPSPSSGSRSSRGSGAGTSAGPWAPRNPGKGLMSTTTGRPSVISRSTPYSCRPRAAPASRAARVQSSGRSAGSRSSSELLSVDSRALRRRAADRSAPITHTLMSNPSLAANSWATTGSSPHSGSSSTSSSRLATRRTRSRRELVRLLTTRGHGQRRPVRGQVAQGGDGPAARGRDAGAVQGLGRGGSGPAPLSVAAGEFTTRLPARSAVRATCRACGVRDLSRTTSGGSCRSGPLAVARRKGLGVERPRPRAGGPAPP